MNIGTTERRLLVVVLRRAGGAHGGGKRRQRWEMINKQTRKRSKKVKGQKGANNEKYWEKNGTEEKLILQHG